MMFCVQAHACLSSSFDWSADGQADHLLSVANALSSSWAFSCSELSTWTSFSLALAFARACAAAALVAELPPPEELEHAAIESAATIDAAPAVTLREVRRDIRIVRGASPAEYY
jgi:hypothetical protein